MRRLRERQEWQFFTVLPQADPVLAGAWWAVLILRGLLPAGFALAMGVLIGAVQRGDDLTAPLVLTGTVFVLLQVLSPIHTAISANLGDRTAAWLYDRLTTACVRPPGMGHLEDPTLTTDLTTARDFDLGTTGPPMSLNVDFIAGGLVELVGGLAMAVVLAGYAWWAPLLLGAPGWRPIGCCGRAGSGGIATPRRCAAPSATPSIPIAWRWTRPPPRSCDYSAWLIGRSTASSPGAPACTSCNIRPRGCVSSRCCGAC
jgi:hypothetical protein